MNYPAEAAVEAVKVVFLLLKNDQRQMAFFLKGGKQNPNLRKDRYYSKVLVQRQLVGGY